MSRVPDPLSMPQKDVLASPGSNPTGRECPENSWSMPSKGNSSMYTNKARGWAGLGRETGTIGDWKLFLMFTTCLKRVRSGGIGGAQRFDFVAGDPNPCILGTVTRAGHAVGPDCPRLFFPSFLSKKLRDGLGGGGMLLKKSCRSGTGSRLARRLEELVSQLRPVQRFAAPCGR